ncbi:hypothetical protein LINPERHAP1_LOCUS40506 [Linum perenne]
MNDDMQTLGLPEVGGVVSYLVDKKLFEVVYRNGKIETMDLDKLQRHRYIATLAGEDQDDIKFDQRFSHGFAFLTVLLAFLIFNFHGIKSPGGDAIDIDVTYVAIWCIRT